MSGKITALLNEKLESVEWGEYVLGNFFEVNSSKKIYHANSVQIYNTRISGSFPYVVRMTTNNGIKGYIIDDIEYTNNENTLTFAQDTFTVFYQKDKYFTGNKVKVLTPLFLNVSPKILRFFAICIQKSISKLSWGVGSTVDSILNIDISLPLKGENINFDFMENFITELEAERITELEAYLKISGLNNYELSNVEKKVINDFLTLDFEEYDLIKVFDVENTSNILSSCIIENSGTIPYLSASAENNAVSSYIRYDKKYLKKGNCIFIGGKTFVVTYQEKDFYSNDSHNLVLYLRNNKPTKANQLFLVTCIYKCLSCKYSWGDSVSKKKIKQDKLYLPSKNGKVDFEIMETLISAIQKLVIKDVVLYTDKKISATKTVVNRK